MLVLALDTATPAVTAGLVELTGAAHTLAERVTVDARAHAELLIPHVMDCLSAAGRTPADLAAVVVGCGPGPFTGLRVGMASAAAFADARHIPVYGVCSLDAIARDADHPGDLLVVTDARRREVYWARYRDGRRIDGPGVAKPADLDPGPATAVAGSPAHTALFGLPVARAERRDGTCAEVTAPSPAGLVGCAAAAVTGPEPPAPLVPLYLRRPDATPPRAVLR